MSCFGCRDQKEKIGVILANLGTPEAPTKAALYPYLKQFLWDPRVIEVNRLLWWFILNFTVLPFRPKRSAALYKRIWFDKGSPLLVISEEQTKAIAKKVKESQPQGVAQNIEFVLGMRYGKPSLESAIDKLCEAGCTKILLFSMYPQYSATTTAATYDVVFSHLLKRRFVPTLKVVDPYYRHPDYINAQADVINDHLKKSDRKIEKLVLSYHGIPQSYVKKGDPYCCMCTETTKALLPKLSLNSDKVIHTFQSQFGKDPWLRPYSDETIENLAKRGIKSIAIACPGFPADCLETLDEMGNEADELFKEHGGEHLELIPCLNTHPSWIAAAASLVNEELQSWVSHLLADKADENGVVCPLTTIDKVLSPLPISKTPC